MATVTFEIDDDVLQNFEKNVPVEQQSAYINTLLAKNMYRENVDKLNDMLQNFRFKYPKNDGISSTDLLRQIRDGDIR